MLALGFGVFLVRDFVFPRSFCESAFSMEVFSAF